MSKDFRWESLGFEIHHEVKIMKEAGDFKGSIKVEQLERLFNLGYYFYNPVHHVTVASLEDFEKYIVQ